ncbi:hypothetical protein BCR37DRAFT_390332 [Protomyces lactucae-debilis]|uniref:Uncharacterized protein n=1 Tax=Protomyces lactucae-debilis TaxID=2754530 RepID=A0A1Y2FYR9_PROLT|nr:uncharacterized protein BCR37DRAFT_390332 [Protomyces lactucae-debilis]ORY87815.1 hypothetical protein BCR37DRAFT_390332 [Protomyces lactucae-debilis]
MASTLNRMVSATACRLLHTFYRSARPSLTLISSTTSRRSIAAEFHATGRLSADSPNVTKAVQELQELFVEAKDEYETALDSAGTTYAAEDNELARECAQKLKERYDALMADSSTLNQKEQQVVKEKLSARVRELVNGVENNLHDH